MAKKKNNKIQCPECRRWVNKDGLAIMNHALNGRKTCKVKGGKGRLPKIDEETVARLIKALKNDMTISQACVLAGINRDTFNEWRKKFPDFAGKIKRARLEFLETASKSVKVGMISDWRAGAWVKERRDKRYREKKEIDVKGKPILIQDAITLQEYEESRDKESN